ncbi:ornithine carbamoyltransferase [Bifidobacterium psychraerophilum]|uniref:Ornithine carbamoyltransferase n=1 Tax=Bifidobacterium psychraerophilum TaxID=218140 RepID=A0A087CI62_9BIFI|nr:ornithine carbamoyltransferase [Bifidobacterium psychraerophilum]KFI82962.1 ornithine carbamoyltransferase [Bifidobacterium psychraerophilum]PKA94710.1 ornithine carbamoyltransferase [Bifidobacterium psychraerophilum DSM 22366]
MEHLLRLTDSWDRSRLDGLFRLADAYEHGRGPIREGCAVLFFPDSSVRTRVTFELGVRRMGLTPVTLPPGTLDKPEASGDVASYLAQWADILVVRHPDITVLEKLASCDAMPVVNAMTDANHPCEVLSDLYSLSKIRNIYDLRYLFVGADGNIGRAWQEAAVAFGLDLTQCSPHDLAMPGTAWKGDLLEASSGVDVIITDGPGPFAQELRPFQITPEVLQAAANDVLLNPCPPFIRGREVSADAIAGPAFVGHEFKKALLPVQQAIMATCMNLT